MKRVSPFIRVDERYEVIQALKSIDCLPDMIAPYFIGRFGYVDKVEWIVNGLKIEYLPGFKGSLIVTPRTGNKSFDIPFSLNMNLDTGEIILDFSRNWESSHGY